MLNVTFAEGGPSPVGLEANTLKGIRGKEEEEGEGREEEEKGEEGEREEEKQSKGKRSHEQVYLEQEHKLLFIQTSHTPCTHTHNISYPHNILHVLL